MSHSKWFSLFCGGLLPLLQGCFATGESEVAAELRAAQSAVADRRAGDRVRTDAARTLGDAGSDSALAALQDAAALNLSSETQDAVVASLGRYPFRRTRTLFAGWLADDGRSTDFKVRAVEALAASDGDAVPLLAETTANHPSPRVRAAAAWAIGQNANVMDQGYRLTELVAAERDTFVRRRLYEALAKQASIPAQRVLEQALQESDPAARIAGFNAVAVALRGDSASLAMVERFAQAAIPELETSALGDGSLNLRLRSVFALIRCGLPEAAGVLGEIALAAPEPVRGAAARGLERLAAAAAP